jgi:shikimate kinase
MASERLFLVGYRGTGKSTVGRLLADELGWGFVDCDDLIESAAGMSIAEIFAMEGEAGFRDRESAILNQLATRERLVIATGGGAVQRAVNRNLLCTSGFVAWLTASPETIWARLQRDPATGTRRPNLTPAGGLEEVRALLAARELLYRSIAHFTADSDLPSPEATATAILTAWRG